MNCNGYTAAELHGCLKCLVETEEKKYNLELLNANPPRWPSCKLEIFAPRIHRLMIIYSSNLWWELGNVRIFICNTIDVYVIKKVQAYWRTQEPQKKDGVVDEIRALIQNELGIEYMKEEIHAMMCILWKETDRVMEKYFFELSVFGHIEDEYPV